MNLIKRLYLRLLKNIELYNIQNITFGSNTLLSNGSIINAKNGSIILGKHTRIGKNSELVSAKNKRIQIKDYSTLYSNCKVLGEVTIERYCVLATNIYMSSGNHFAFEHPELLIRIQDKNVREKQTDINKPIHIHEDVWIGNGVFISQGITIGRGAVIGAGSIITKNIKPYQVVVGNPGRVIKNRLDFNPPTSINAQDTVDWPYFYQGFDHWNGYTTKSKKGLQLIDDGIVLFHSTVNAISIKGFSNLACSLNINVNKKHFTHKLPEGDFTIQLTGWDQIGQENLEISIPFPKLQNQQLFINSITKTE